MQTSQMPSQNKSTYQILSESDNAYVLKSGGKVRGEGAEFSERGGMEFRGKNENEENAIPKLIYIPNSI